MSEQISINRTLASSDYLPQTLADYILADLPQRPYDAKPLAELFLAAHTVQKQRAEAKQNVSAVKDFYQRFKDMELDFRQELGPLFLTGGIFATIATLLGASALWLTALVMSLVGAALLGSYFIEQTNNKRYQQEIAENTPPASAVYEISYEAELQTTPEHPEGVLCITRLIPRHGYGPLIDKLTYALRQGDIAAKADILQQARTATNILNEQANEEYYKAIGYAEQKQQEEQLLLEQEQQKQTQAQLNAEAFAHLNKEIEGTPAGRTVGS
jgi:hypothetical protein